MPSCASKKQEQFGHGEVLPSLNRRKKLPEIILDYITLNCAANGNPKTN